MSVTTVRSFRKPRQLPAKDKILSFDNDVITLIHWWLADKPERLRMCMAIQSVADVVQETCIQLLSVSDAVFAEVKWTTIVCNQAKWTMYRLYEKRKRCIVSHRDVETAFAGKCLAGWFNQEDQSQSQADSALRSELEEAYRIVVSKLPYRLHGIIDCRLQGSMTLRETAKVFSVTTERIRQLESKAIRILQQYSTASLLTGFLD